MNEWMKFQFLLVLNCSLLWGSPHHSMSIRLALLNVSCFQSFLAVNLLLSLTVSLSPSNSPFFSLSLFPIHNYSHISGMDFFFVIKLLFGSLLPSGKSPRPSMILSLIPSIVSWLWACRILSVSGFPRLFHISVPFNQLPSLPAMTFCPPLLQSSALYFFPP